MPVSPDKTETMKGNERSSIYLLERIKKTAYLRQ